MEEGPELYFPLGWDCSDSNEVFDRICRKLHSKKAKELDRLESYVLYRAIEDMRAYLWANEERETMPLEDREELIRALGSEVVEHYEDMYFWPDLCFPDTDFLMLDEGVLPDE